MTQFSAIRIGEWIAHPASGDIVNGSLTRHLQPKAMDVLVCLAKHAPEVVERDVLLRQVWGPKAVSDEPLTRCIAEIRKKVGDRRTDPTYIATVSKRGYRLLAEVQQISAPEANAEPASITQVFPPLEDIPPRSIAVLPFRDLSGDRDLAHIAEGVAEEITMGLAKIPDLKVAARFSSASVSHENHQIIGSTLGVRFVMEGSVNREQHRLKVNVTVTDVKRGYQRFSQTFEGQGEDLIEIQESLGEKVVACLPPSMVENPQLHWRPTRTPSAEVYDLYLKGRYALNQRELQKASKFLEQAITSGGDFAALYEACAATLALMPTYSATSNPRMALSDATRFAKKALKMDPESPLALAVMGRIYLSSCQWNEAREVLEQAIKKYPRDPSARLWYGCLQVYMGEPLKGLEQFERARELDPLSPVIYTEIAWALYLDKQYERAEDCLLIARSLSEDDSRSLIPTLLWSVYLAEARYDDAFAEMRRDKLLNQLADDDYRQLIDAIADYQARGQAGEVLVDMEARIPSPAITAHLYALTGCVDRTLSCLQRAFQDMDPLAAYAYVNPALEHIRRSPKGKLLLASAPSLDE